MMTMKMPKVTVGNATSNGSTKPIMLPKSAPDMPRKKAATAKPVVFTRMVRMPMPSAFSSSSRIALAASPKRPENIHLTNKKVMTANPKPKK